MTQWANYVRKQARLIIDQLADLQRHQKIGGESSAIDSYYKMLEDLFDQDLRLAQLRDDSDLLMRAEGEAFDHDPRLQLVSSIFSNVTTQVTGLTNAILGVRADGKITSTSVELGLSGMAKGSLYFGLKAQLPDKKAPLLGDADSLYDSTVRALKIIDDVAHTVQRDDEIVSLEEVSEVVVDPRVRDAALVAVQRISPSGRRGIDSISVSGGERAPAELTPLVRKAIRASLDKPVIRGEIIEFVGQVREIDLDARRFELRGIADLQVRDVRCAYRNVKGVNPKALLGATIRARGLVDRAPDDIPRLMSVTDIEFVREAPDHIE
jgi:hypothetical protein